jgi:hypothetical protein
MHNRLLEMLDVLVRNLITIPITLDGREVQFNKCAPTLFVREKILTTRCVGPSSH